MNAEPEKSAENLYIVKHEKNFLAWLAWKNWLRDELQKTFFPHTMTTLYAWPPETWEKAKIVAEWYNASRARIKWGKSVPDNPKPWRHWSREEMNDLENSEILRRERDHGWYPPAVTDGRMDPRDGFHRASAEDHERARLDQIATDEWQKNLVVEAKRKPYRASTRRELAALKSQDRPPIPYVEASPELVAERMARLQAKLPNPLEP